MKPETIRVQLTYMDRENLEYIARHVCSTLLPPDKAERDAGLVRTAIEIAVRHIREEVRR